MRAKMSDAGHGDLARWNAAGRFVVGGSLARHYAEMALDEARAILAENEAHGPEFGCLWPNEPGRQVMRGACLPYAERHILADALRAFVGEPCGCAGGMHWSLERGYFHCNGIVPEA